MQRIFHRIKVVSLNNTLTNIECLEKRLIFVHQIKNQNSWKIIPPYCLFYSSSHVKANILTDSQQIHHQLVHKKKWIAQSLFGCSDSGILLRANKNHLRHQSSRFISDVAANIGSDVPLTKYERAVSFLVDSAPVEFAQNSFIWLHTTTGLPWWAIVVLVTCTARTFVTLPLTLYQQYIFAKLSNLKYEMNELIPELKMEANRAVYMFGWKESYVRGIYNRSVKKQWNKLIIKENCHPMKGLIVLMAQVPMWVFISAGFRNLSLMLPQPTPVAQETYMQLSVEGFGWITNLAAADSYWILPISLGLLNLLNIEIQALSRKIEAGKFQKIGINIFRGLAIIMVPVASLVPSCISLYWVTSCAYGILQSFIIVSPRVRRLVKIPECDEELDHPYIAMYDNFKKRISWRNSREVV